MSRQHPATSVEECQAACIHNASCTGVDWAPTLISSRYSPCWLSGPWSGHKNVGIYPGFTHYSIIRNCTGKFLQLMK